jgi:hypothetical protein
MGRDTWRYRAEEREREQKKQLNPVWRGVGCVLVIALAVGGYFFGEWFLRQNQSRDWISIPSELIRLPGAPWLPDGFVFKLGVAILFFIITFGLLNIFYAIFFPIRLSEVDSPPLKPRGNKRR